ncbi:MAG: HU family DNA-binding protein [Lentisphaerae bacterium]|nr:HU family DNA-binding protein [Lentisphaerota bacterium]
MNKTELTEKLAKMTGLPKVKAGEVVDALFDARPGKGIIAIELDKGRKVAIPGFGTFSSRSRKARKGRNPATGKAITIAAKNYPVFRAGKTLKDRVAK